MKKITLLFIFLLWVLLLYSCYSLFLIIVFPTNGNVISEVSFYGWGFLSISLVLFLSKLKKFNNIKDITYVIDKIIKSRIYFYPVLFVLSFLIGYVPYKIDDPTGLEGLTHLFNWFLLLIINIIIYLIYEFKHLPDKDKIDFKFQRRLGLVYLNISLFYLLYIIVFYLFQAKLKQDFSISSFTFGFAPILFIIAILVIVILNFIHHRFAKNLKTISRKIAIITTLFMIASLIFSIIYVPKTIKSYKKIKNNLIFNESIANSDLEKCKIVKDENVCKRVIAIKDNNIQLCLEIPEFGDGDYRLSRRHECLYEIAINTKNEEVCNQVDKYINDKWGTAGELCRRGILIAELRELTEGLSDEEITMVAIDSNNINLCLTIRHEQNKHDCELEVAKLNNISF